jgi:UDP-N-acetylglucosamine/UDP-N-acetylgalactosamine 4-epimerase
MNYPIQHSMTRYQAVRAALRSKSHHWLVTGVAGFIGSNLLETLLKLGQQVTGIDNFITGSHDNLDQVRTAVGEDRWRCFTFIEDDIRDLTACHKACRCIDYVLHQAALGSVSRSIEDPLLTHDINVSGFLNVLTAARDARVPRIIYASSSATYGDHPTLPKIEDNIGKPLSPYALSKYIDELYAAVFARCYRIESIGLRYFNVFGPRQDPAGTYAAVIPRWIASMVRCQKVYINGDGETSRDFCFVDNVVQANLLAALVGDKVATNRVYNVAVNARTSLNDLFHILRTLLTPHFPHLKDYQPHYVEFRSGDVRHSQADIANAVSLLGYLPTHDLARGLAQTVAWHLEGGQRAMCGKPD